MTDKEASCLTVKMLARLKTPSNCVERLIEEQREGAIQGGQARDAKRKVPPASDSFEYAEEDPIE
tara:strand:+ start:267 stop:461 length:195 start_codon:yes stop_codon:yes gene_type:complete